MCKCLIEFQSSNVLKSLILLFILCRFMTFVFAFKLALQQSIMIGWIILIVLGEHYFIIKKIEINEFLLYFKEINVCYSTITLI